MLVRATDSIDLDPGQYPNSVILLAWECAGEKPTLMYQGVGEGLLAAPDAETEEYSAWRFDKRWIGTLNAPFVDPFPMGYVDLTFYCGVSTKPKKVRIAVAKTSPEAGWELSLYLGGPPSSGEGLNDDIVRIALPGFDPNDETAPVIVV
jgi:hypothetical protein